MRMVKKEYLISRDYLELPIAAETEVQTLQVFDKDTGAKIYEFQVPMGTEEKEFHPDFYARLSVKNFIGKTLILTGCGMMLSSREYRKLTGNSGSRITTSRKRALRGRNIISQP